MQVDILYIQADILCIQSDIFDNGYIFNAVLNGGDVSQFSKGVGRSANIRTVIQGFSLHAFGVMPYLFLNALLKLF
jgi:hypothetical protein